MEGAGRVKGVLVGSQSRSGELAGLEGAGGSESRVVWLGGKVWRAKSTLVRVGGLGTIQP